MEKALAAAAEFLDEMANRLDSWADGSLSGGWSTHQVASNRKAADDCRREAARIRLALSRANVLPMRG